MRGLKPAYYCSHGSCRKGACFQAVDGSSFCKKHGVSLFLEFGYNFFWAHYWRELCDEVNKQLIIDRKRKLKEILYKQEEEEYKNSLHDQTKDIDMRGYKRKPI